MEPQVADRPLTDCLGALSSPTRLAVIRALRAPKALKEIDVRAGPDAPPMARQTIRTHLDVLLAVGLATARRAERPYGETQEFVVNHQRLFALSEEVRALARIAPTIEPSVITAPSEDYSPLQRGGPCLVLVKGLDEGRIFDLTPQTATRNWVIGRRRGLAVTLDFDPSTSGENAILRWNGKTHTVEDVPASRNGTTLDFRRLRPGEQVPLSNGQLIGVGRCILVYRS